VAQIELLRCYRRRNQWLSYLIDLGEKEKIRIETHTKTPIRIPEDPSPEIARPAMSAAELGAVADTIDPISSIPTAITKTHFTRNCS
jgi:hypothetical protein